MIDKQHDLFVIGKKSSGKKQKPPKESKNTLFSKQIARILDVIGEGEITKFGDGDDIYEATFFNEVPVKDVGGALNFLGVELDSRKGTDSQSYLRNFDNVENETSVEVEVTKDGGAISRTVSDTDTDDLRITVSIPALMKTSDKGDVEPNTLKLAITITPNGGNETTVINGNDGSSSPGYIHGKCTSEYNRSFLIEDIFTTYGAGPWVVKVYKLTDDATNLKIQNTLVWSTYTTIKNIKLTNMSTAVVGITLDTENFTDNAPTRQYNVYGLKVRYSDTYDPVARTYTGIWDGETFNTGYTNNPAWILLDLLTNVRYGFGYDDSQIDLSSIYEMAQYNDDDVEVVERTRQNDGSYSDSTSSEPRFTFNGVIDDRQQGYTVILSVAQTCRAFPIWVNGTISFVQDRPTSVTRIASPANVIDGLFNYEGTSKRQRFTGAKVIYNDFTNFCRATPITIEDDEAISLYGFNPIDITLIGCTSRSEAIRRAKYIIYTGLNETEIVKFVGGLEWADCIPGEVIAVQDPDYANVNLSGRIANSTTTSITLDRSITLGAGTNTVIIQQNTTDVVEKTLTNSAGSTNVLTWTGALSAAPQKGNVWVVSTANTALRTFRVMSVKEEELGRYNVQAIQYDPNKYAAVEDGFTFETPQESFIQAGKILPPTSITTQNYSYTEGVQDIRKYGVVISWVASADPRTDNYELRYKFNDTGWVDLGESVGNSFDWKDVQPGTYDIAVRAVALTGYSEWTTAADITVQTYTAIQSPQNLRVKDGTNQFVGKDCTVEWDTPAGAYYDSTSSEILTSVEISSGFVKQYKIEVYDTDTMTLRRTYTTASGNELEYTYFYADNLTDNNGTPVRSLTFKVYSVSFYDDESDPAERAVSNPAPDMSSVTPTVTARPNYLDIDWNISTDLDMSFYHIYGDTSNPPTTLIHKVYHPNQFAEMFNVSYGTTYYIQIEPYDGFGAGTKSQVASGSPLLIPNINVDLELRNSITMSTTLDYSGDLESLYNRVFDSGGITATPEVDEYIDYEYEIENYFDRVAIWCGNSNAQVYFGLSVDGSSWTYYKALGTHALDTDKQLDPAVTQADARTNYWQLENGFNVALLPDNVTAKKVRMFFVNTNSTIIYEFVPSRLIISELAAIESLSAISANIGTVVTGLIQSEDYPTSGLKIDIDNGTITGAVTFKSGSSGYGQISDKPTQLSDINIGQANDLSKVVGWSHPSDTTKIDGGDLFAGSSINIGTGSGGGMLRIGATSFLAGTGIWMGDDSGTYKFRAGDPSGDRIYWDGSKLYLQGQMVIAASSSGYSNLTDKPTLGSLAGKSTIGATDCDTTIISGGKIITGLLTASNITTGTLDASLATITNINATNITAGSLNVDRIVAGSITYTKLGSNTITNRGSSTGTTSASTSVTRVGGDTILVNAGGNLGCGSYTAYGPDVGGGYCTPATCAAYIRRGTTSGTILRSIIDSGACGELLQLIGMVIDVPGGTGSQQYTYTGSNSGAWIEVTILAR